MARSSGKQPQRKLLKDKKTGIAVIVAIGVLIVFMILVLTHVICLWHNFSDATVIKPRTCCYCGKTEGEAKPLSNIEFPAKGLASLLPPPKSNMGEIEWESSDSVYINVGNTTKRDFSDYIELCSDNGFDVDYQKGDDYYYADDKNGNRLSLYYNENNIMSIQILSPYEEITESSAANTIIETSSQDDKTVIETSAYESIIHPNIRGRKFAEFQTKYEESLVPILEDASLDLIAVEYTPLVPDYELDYYEIDRINEYEVRAYVNGIVDSYEDIYDIIVDIRCANNYLLSNKYEIMSSGAYVDDDSREKGFHQVSTILVFEDDSEYRIDFRSLLKDGEAVYKRGNHSGGSSNVYSYGGKCGYPGCDHNSAEGKPYCHRHSCGENGCNNSTDLLPSYCDQHNCTYGSCSAPRYSAVGSSYCQRHYIETH